MERNKNRALLKALLAIAIALVLLWGYVEIESSSVVPVLMYHAFRYEKSVSTPCVSPEIFGYTIEFLVKHGYNVVGPEKVIDYMTKKEKMPPNTVSITVDDGCMDFYDHAYPLLKKYNIRAALFVITDRIGKDGYMGWKELREVSDSGLVTIGSHTKSHPWMPTASVDEKKLREELELSKEILEKGLGKKVDYLCYPNGGFNDLVKYKAKEAGYKGAFTTNPDRKSSIGDIYAIRRIKMSSSSDNSLLLWGKMSKYYAWYKERR